MKNFYRAENVNGHPHVWMYTDHADRLVSMPCNKEGWVDAKKYLPDDSADVLVTVVSDGVSRIGRNADRVVFSDGRRFWAGHKNVVGWHPKLEPMEVAG